MDLNALYILIRDMGRIAYDIYRVFCTAQRFTFYLNTIALLDLRVLDYGLFGRVKMNASMKEGTICFINGFG